jgi:putative ABC transport system permease protein
MGGLRVLVSRLFDLFRTRRLDESLDAELQAHLQLLSEENIRRGMAPEEAREAARREFGGVEQTKQACHQQRGILLIDSVMQDLRFALRILVKSPAFAAVAMVTLALGIGATTAVFSVVDRILFRSLPYSHDDRLVAFGLTAPIEKDEFMLGTSYIDFRETPGPFEQVTSMIPGDSKCDLTEERPVRLSCAYVEQRFLSTLGVRPILGRNFTLDEDRPKAARVAILSFPLWKSRFGGDPGVVGTTISLDGSATRIVGVLPANFEMPTLTPAEILVPQALDEELQRRSPPGAVLRTFGRMKPGATVAEVIVGLQPFLEQSLQGAPPAFRKEIHLSVSTLHDRQIHDARLASWILLGSVFAVLLVACTNVASLQLARATGRQRELAVRVALGASRGRLVRQAFVESTLLGLLGGTAGCLVAHLLLRLFVSIAPQGIPRLQQAGLDLRVVSFTFAVSIVSAAVFGLAAALSDPSPGSLIGKQVRATTRSLVRLMLVAAQISVSLALLACAGLLLRSLWNLQRTPTGMETERVVTETVSLAEFRYPKLPQQIDFFSRLLARLKAFPGITGLAVSDTLPPAGQMRSTILAAVEPEGHPALAEGTGGAVAWRAVTPGYFSALGVGVLRGRDFQERDSWPSENPIILSETLARMLFGKEDPVGKQLRLFRQQTPWRTVIGVAADVRNNGLVDSSDPEFYLPWKDDPVESLSTGQIIMRTRMEPGVVAAWMRSETSALDPTLPVKIEAMTKRVDQLTERPRFNAVLLSLFACIGVALAAIGIYAVVAFLVAQQTREIGVRMALGASPHSVMRMVLWNVIRWAIGGATLGLIAAWFSTRLLQSLLFEVRVHDPVPLVLALLLLLAVTLVAAWIPARRALRVDPMVALRYE